MRLLPRSATTCNKLAEERGSALHRLDFKNDEKYCIQSYGVKKTNIQMSTGLSGPDSVHLKHDGGRRSNIKGVCGPGLPKTLPTDVASPCVHCFREAGWPSCISLLYMYFSCLRMDM